MPVNIFGGRFLEKESRRPAWHGLGETFTEPMTAIDAVEKGRMDYKVYKAPAYADAGPGHRTAVPDTYFLTRDKTEDDPQYRFFGTCSDAYEVLDNLEIARALDTLTDRWPVETIGGLAKGKTLFVALDAGLVNIGKNGEELHQYFVFTDSKDGKQKAKFMFTPVRVVCQNTLVLAQRQATVSAQITHRSGASQALQFRIDLVDRLLKTQELNLETLQAMAAVNITNRQAAQIISAAYPVASKGADAVYFEDEKALKGLGKGDLADQLFKLGERASGHHQYIKDRSKEFEQFATMLYDQINDEHPNIARTPWAAYNAVVEAADYRGGRGNIEVSALFGPRSKEKVRAFESAVRVTAKVS